MRNPGAALVAVMVLACGPEQVEVAELEDVCGHESPYRIAELDDEIVPIPTYSGLQIIGDRIYAIVGAPVGPPSSGSYAQPLPDHTQAISFGLCGQDRRTIADDVWRIFEDEHAPGLLFGHAGIQAGDVVVLDPKGVSAPATFAVDVDPLDEWADSGIVTKLPHRFWEDPSVTTIEVWLRPFPADPLAGPVDSVRLLEGIAADYSSVVTRGDEVFARRVDGEVVVFDLVDGGIERIVDAVDSFGVSDDARWFYWETDAGLDDPDARASFVLDRSTGSQTAIGVGLGSVWWPPLTDELVKIELPSESGFSERVVFLPTFDTYDVRDPFDVQEEWKDGWWIAETDEGFGVYRLATGESRVAYEGPWAAAWQREGAFEILASGDLSNPYPQGPLLRAPFEGGEPEPIAHRATAWWDHLDDDRVVTHVGRDARLLGDLVVVDPETLDEQRIDHRVLLPGGGPLYREAYGDDRLLYAVRDGDRSGIWLARVTVAP